MDKVLRENSMLRGQIIRLTQKLMDAENKRAELEECGSKDFRGTSILQSLDEAKNLNITTRHEKPSIKPVVSQNSLTDSEVVSRITRYVETVCKHLKISYAFNFKNDRQFEYAIKLLRDRMREERLRVDFLNETREEYKQLLDNKCKEYYELSQRFKEARDENGRLETLDLGVRTSRLATMDQQTGIVIEERRGQTVNPTLVDKLIQKIEGLRKDNRVLLSENRQLQNQITDTSENRKSLLKQKELLYDQYMLMKTENEKLKQAAVNESVSLVNQHFAETFVKFIECLGKSDFCNARILLSILGNHANMSSEKSRGLMNLFSKVEERVSK